MHTPSNWKTAIVLGANGRLGAAAVQAFAAAGWRVLAQARRGERLHGRRAQAAIGAEHEGDLRMGWGVHGGASDVRVADASV